jgi:hypothetical protein
LVVNTIEDEFILEVWVQLDGATWEQINLLYLFTTQEVLDFKTLRVLGDLNINGEMSMYESHLVSVALHTY